MLGDLFLSIDDVEPPQHRERVAALLQRGYDVIASVHTATGRLTQVDKCSTAPLSDAALASASAEAKRALALRSGAVAATIALPPGSNITTASTGLPAGGGAAATAPRGPAPTAAAAAAPPPPPPCHLRQLNRLHFVAVDAVQASQLAGAETVVRSYDLVSITPKSERVMHQACTSLDVDVISLELSQRLTIKLRAVAIKAALRRGIYFEICYAPGLREPTARRNLFCNAQALVRATRGKNILISSSARSAFEVRSPLEVLHMATLFGLTHKQAQDALSLAPRAVLARAAARAAGRGASAVLAGPTAAAAAGAAATAAAAADAAGGDTEMQDTQPEASEPAEPQQPQAQAAKAQPARQAQQPLQQRPGAPAAGGGRGGGRKRAAAGR
ncbi:hypothetical protein PLESTB_000127600 [Pleodorina starrii]|uniref:Uncharacterized protein n=1 Tax=Pleodorina starrii TaxID=330485 RepID=A0A9W6EXR2_9CHLO|nr:hypothetical protein PLESTB_000127600 [Pleodorina starrii]GLC74255.1 hypothetical protein PLESTF_001481500 [Pleodorina starrii]